MRHSVLHRVMNSPMTRRASARFWELHLERPHEPLDDAIALRLPTNSMSKETGSDLGRPWGTACVRWPASRTGSAIDSSTSYSGGRAFLSTSSASIGSTRRKASPSVVQAASARASRPATTGHAAPYNERWSLPPSSMFSTTARRLRILAVVEFHSRDPLILSGPKSGRRSAGRKHPFVRAVIGRIEFFRIASELLSSIRVWLIVQTRLFEAVWSHKPRTPPYLARPLSSHPVTI